MKFHCARMWTQFPDHLPNCVLVEAELELLTGIRGHNMTQRKAMETDPLKGVG